jgi:hypothetical protein
MKRERIKILELLEAGKITSEEAVKLFEALASGCSCNTGAPGMEYDPCCDEAAGKFKRFTRQMDGFAREFGAKVNNAYRNVEPKIKRASHTALEKTARIFEEISRSLQETVDKAKAKTGSDAEGDGDCCCTSDATAADDCCCTPDASAADDCCTFDKKDSCCDADE